MEMISLPVEIVASLDDSAKSQELRGLLQEIELMSDKITLTERSDNERKPSFSINRSGTDISVRIAGIPMGHEFTSLVLALLQVGGHPIKLDQAVIDHIRNLDCDVEFETYFTALKSVV